MPKVKLSELSKLDAEGEQIIYHLPSKTTLAKKILNERKLEDDITTEYQDMYDLRPFLEDGRNSVFPSKAIWPWPRPKKQYVGMDLNWHEEDDDFSHYFVYPMSSVRPQEVKPFKSMGNKTPETRNLLHIIIEDSFLKGEELITA